MKTITIYGASDDLIEIEGDLREEFSSYENEITHLGFSDGTVLSVHYGDDGFWRMNRLSVGSAEFEKTEGQNEDSDYSDRVTLRGDIRWVIAGKEFTKVK